MSPAGDGPLPRVVVTGVAASGKSTIGELLARELGVPFVEGDDFHPPANRERMARGEPLDDAARAPWLAAMHAHLLANAARGFVLACSALRQRYRDVLARDLPGVRWVYLQVPADELQRRLARRRGHFFPPSLLASQLATWEPLREGMVADGAESPPRIVAAIVAWLRSGPSSQAP